MLSWVGVADAMLGEVDDGVGANGAIDPERRRVHEAMDPVTAQKGVLHC